VLLQGGSVALEVWCDCRAVWRGVAWFGMRLCGKVEAVEGRRRTASALPCWLLLSDSDLPCHAVLLRMPTAGG